MKNHLKRFEQVLQGQGLLIQEDIQRIRTETDAEVAEAQKFTEESPDPSPEDAFNAIYATSHS